MSQNLFMKHFDQLVEQGLAVKKQSSDDFDFVLYKYHNRVFYDNLWHLSPLLSECRGIVFNTVTGQIVQRPFHKIFNVGENGQETPENCERRMKVNGFMCAATLLPEDTLFFSTTGSSNSEYVGMARTYIDQLNWAGCNSEYTYLFEICDPRDPHIVQEQQGAYLLSARHKQSGRYLLQTECDQIAAVLGAKRPQQELDLKKEGWVYYDQYGTPIAKVKTAHYLSKKAFMRLGKRQAKIMFQDTEEFRKRLDEEFYEILDYLVNQYTESEYTDLSEQERRRVIEEYFNDI